MSTFFFIAKYKFTKLKGINKKIVLFLQDSSQIELLKALMDLQKDMVVMLLSMLEGRRNVKGLLNAFLCTSSFACHKFGIVDYPIHFSILSLFSHLVGLFGLFFVMLDLLLNNWLI